MTAKIQKVCTSDIINEGTVLPVSETVLSDHRSPRSLSWFQKPYCSFPDVLATMFINYSSAKCAKVQHIVPKHIYRLMLICTVSSLHFNIFTYLGMETAVY